MTARDEIKQWLLAPVSDFEAGLALYQKYGNNQRTMQMLLANDQNAKACLYDHIHGLLRNLPKDQPAAINLTPRQPRHVTNTVVAIAETSAEYTKQVQALMIQRAILANSLWEFDVTDSRGRSAVMAQIKHINDQLSAMRTEDQSLLRAGEQLAKVAVSEPSGEEDFMAMERRLNSSRNSAARYRKLITMWKEDPRKLAKYQAQFDEHAQEVRMLSEKLGRKTSI